MIFALAQARKQRKQLYTEAETRESCFHRGTIVDDLLPSQPSPTSGGLCAIIWVQQYWGRLR